MVTRLQLSLWGQVSSDHPPPSAQLNQPTYEREPAYFVLSKEKSTIMRTPPISSARLLCYLAITLIVFTLAVSIPANAAPGAGFTTFDTSLLGCLDSPNGIDCNNYAAKEDVFMNGGPNAAGLSDGGYFFAVLVPGFQNGGFLDGANGNLSDITASNGGPGGGDDVSNRTFTVSNHLISSYGGTHFVGIDPQGHQVIQLLPYDDTSNPGGVYILAICSVNATGPSQCKYDAFRIKKSTVCTTDCAGPATINVCKFWDQNADHSLNGDEPLLGAWPITATNVDPLATQNTNNTVITDPTTGISTPSPDFGCVTFTHTFGEGETSVDIVLTEGSGPGAGSKYCNSSGCPMTTPSGPWTQSAPWDGNKVLTSETITLHPGDAIAADPFGNYIAASTPTDSKTANGSYTQPYSWGITKSVDKTLVEQSGNSFTFTYTVAVTRTAQSITGIQVKGAISVNNTNSVNITIDSVSDQLSDSAGTCSLDGSPSFPASIPPGTTSYSYTCAISGTVPSGETNNATVTWSTQVLSNGATLPGSTDTPSHSVAYTASLVDDCVNLTDPNAPSGTFPNPVCASASFTYKKTVTATGGSCTTVNNTATFITNTTSTTGSDSQKVELCNEATGALTMGFWQNKNGQGIISAASQTALGAWLRQYHPFSDAPSSGLATYVYNIIKVATCTSTSKTCNTMLRAQMLATALDVYFSDPSLGGNKIGAPGPIGSVSIDLSHVCNMIDGSGGTATCPGTFSNVAGLFGVTKCDTVSAMLAYQNTKDPLADAGAVWYGNVKASQVGAKNAFDAINNKVASICP